MQRIKKALMREGIPFEENCPLAEKSSFRIGGSAEIGILPSTQEQMIRTLELLSEYPVRHAVVGRGSNLLFPDGLWQGAVVFTERMRALSVNGCEITADAGVSLASLAKAARDAVLTGAEFAAGIPGSVGGATVMNAGAYGFSMEQIVRVTDYWSPETGRRERLMGNEHAFGYRTSFFTSHPTCTVLSASFLLQKGEAEEICARMEDFKQRRRAAQPLELPSAGSTFKRPEGFFAGKLIEDCGLKGMRVGGAEVSEKHAGFIVNRGGATAEDVKRLIELIRARVYAAFGVELECELRFLE